MLTQLGFENHFVAGTIVAPYGSGGHAWNLVKVDGNWHHLDATWGDFGIENKVQEALVKYPNMTESQIRDVYEPVAAEQKSDYFLISDSAISESRTWDTAAYPEAPTSYVAPEGEVTEENPYGLNAADLALEVDIRALIGEIDVIMLKGNSEITQLDVDSIRTMVSQIDVLLATVENEELIRDLDTEVTAAENVTDLYQTVVTADAETVAQIDVLIEAIGAFALEDSTTIVQSQVDTMDEYLVQIEALTTTLVNTLKKSGYESDIPFLKDFVDSMQESATENAANEGNHLSDSDMNLISQINDLVQQYDEIVMLIINEPNQKYVTDLAQLVSDIDALILQIEDEVIKSDYAELNENNRGGLELAQQIVDDSVGQTEPLNENDINLISQIDALVNQYDDVVLQNILEPNQELVTTMTQLVSEIDVLITQIEDKSIKSEYTELNENNRLGIALAQEIVDNALNPEDPVDPVDPVTPVEPVVPPVPEIPVVPTQPITPVTPTTPQEPSSDDKGKETVVIENPKTPAEIEKEVKKVSYMKVDEFKTIMSRTGDDKSFVLVNGKTVFPDVKPIILEARKKIAFVPVKFIAEALGFDVKWVPGQNGQIHRVYIQKSGFGILINIGSNIAYLNGKAIQMNNLAFVENERTYLSIEAIIELLKAKIDYFDVGSHTYLNVMPM